MWTKICGITRIEDAQRAIEAGASAIGFIFASSPRQISEAAAHSISQQLPVNIDRVGVFLDSSLEKINAIAEKVGLTVIQLHGHEDWNSVSFLAQRYRLLKTWKITPQGEIPHRYEGDWWKILFDTAIAGKAGGTGQVFSRAVLSQFDLNRVIVGGGLNPDNIGDLLEQYQPFGLDIASGVEYSPGLKDPQKIKRLFQAIYKKEMK